MNAVVIAVIIMLALSLSRVHVVLSLAVGVCRRPVRMPLEERHQRGRRCGAARIIPFLTKA